MVGEVVVGVIVVVVVGVLARIAGLTEVPRKLRQWETTVNRAKTDYGVWAKRRDASLQEELQQIDEEHNARGLYHSGIRLEARARAHGRATNDVEDQLRVLSRKIDDAFHGLRRVDRAWLGFRYRRGLRDGLKTIWVAMTRPLGSMEEDILEPVLSRRDHPAGSADD